MVYRISIENEKKSITLLVSGTVVEERGLVTRVLNEGDMAEIKKLLETSYQKIKPSDIRQSIFKIGYGK